MDCKWLTVAGDQCQRWYLFANINNWPLILIWIYTGNLSHQISLAVLYLLSRDQSNSVWNCTLSVCMWFFLYFIFHLICLDSHRLQSLQRCYFACSITHHALLCTHSFQIQDINEDKPYCADYFVCGSVSRMVLLAPVLAYQSGRKFQCGFHWYKSCLLGLSLFSSWILDLDLWILCNPTTV